MRYVQSLEFWRQCIYCTLYYTSTCSHWYRAQITNGETIQMTDPSFRQSRRLNVDRKVSLDSIRQILSQSSKRFLTQRWDKLLNFEFVFRDLNIASFKQEVICTCHEFSSDDAVTINCIIISDTLSHHSLTRTSGCSVLWFWFVLKRVRLQTLGHRPTDQAEVFPGFMLPFNKVHKQKRDRHSLPIACFNDICYRGRR
jgi:hypothetical protein